MLDRLAAFVAALRAAGINAGPDAVADLATALTLDGVMEPARFRGAARAICVSRRDQFPAFERIFDRFWLGRRSAAGADTDDEAAGGGGAGGDGTDRAELRAVADSGNDNGAGRGEEDVDLMLYSRHDALLHKDLGRLSDAELRLAREIAARLVRELGVSAGRRVRAAGGGRRVDWRRTLRTGLARHGELLPLRYRRPARDRLHLAMLCDVSGSMAAYARFVVTFMLGIAARVPDVVLGTFATHLSLVDTSSAAVDHGAPDWSRTGDIIDGWGTGTDIGRCLAEFNRTVNVDRHVTLVILSDGWDRGSSDLVGEELAVLRERVRRIVWLNPLLGQPGYRPETGGMRAALPYIDDFLPAHSLASLGQACRMLVS